MPQAPESAEEAKYKYETYLDERASLAAAKKESSQYFDKSILTLASGALGLSLAFINKISPAPRESTLIFLCLSWILLCASMLSTLVSFLTSQHACQKRITIIEKSYFGTEEEIDDRNVLGTITVILNWSSIALFIFGIASLIVFSVLNI